MPTREEMLNAKIEEMGEQGLARITEIFQKDGEKALVFILIFQIKTQAMILEMNEAFGGKATHEILQMYADMWKEIHEFNQRMNTN